MQRVPAPAARLEQARIGRPATGLPRLGPRALCGSGPAGRCASCSPGPGRSRTPGSPRPSSAPGCNCIGWAAGGRTTRGGGRLGCPAGKRPSNHTLQVAGRAGGRAGGQAVGTATQPACRADAAGRRCPAEEEERERAPGQATPAVASYQRQEEAASATQRPPRPSQAGGAGRRPPGVTALYFPDRRSRQGAGPALTLHGAVGGCYQGAAYQGGGGLAWCQPPPPAPADQQAVQQEPGVEEACSSARWVQRSRSAAV